MTPREGNELQYVGLVGSHDDPESDQEAVEMATRNALAAAETCLREGERIGYILSMTVFFAAEPGFEDHARIADHASRLIASWLGDHAIGSRVAVSVASLPSRAPVAICMVAAAEGVDTGHDQ